MYPASFWAFPSKNRSTFPIQEEKGRLSFRLTAPYSEERRRVASEQAKQNGIHKKVADLP